MNSWSEWLDGLAPISGQIFPGWVHAFDECHALGPIESFDLFLAANGMPYVLVLFEVYEAIDFVSLRETLEFTPLMLKDAIVDAVGHSGVNTARFTGHNVDQKRNSRINRTLVETRLECDV